MEVSIHTFLSPAIYLECLNCSVNTCTLKHIYSMLHIWFQMKQLNSDFDDRIIFFGAQKQS